MFENISKQADFKDILKIRKYAVLPILVVFIIVFLSILVVAPRIKLVYEKNKDLETAEINLEQLESKLTFLESIDQAEISEKIETCEKVLPSKKSILDWILSVKGLSDEHNININGIAFKPGSIATASASYSEIERANETQKTKKVDVDEENLQRRIKTESKLESFKLSIDTSGTFGDLLNFIDDSILMYPIVRIVSLDLISRASIAMSREALLQNPMQAQMQIILFYSEYPESIASISEKIIQMSEREEEIYNEILEYSSHKRDDLYEIEVGKEDIFSL